MPFEEVRHRLVDIDEWSDRDLVDAAVVIDAEQKRRQALALELKRQGFDLSRNSAQMRRTDAEALRAQAARRRHL